MHAGQLFSEHFLNNGIRHTDANQAYCLTPDEVRLMWATAPPRMPLTPPAEPPTTNDPSEADDDAAA
jgi:hypothetical protein